ncbi:MAG TPA: hypothetical protein VF898_02795 [Chloroflexota bacterium]
MSDDLNAEYRAAIRSMAAARKQYADACEYQGPESWAAEMAKDYLTREIQHRDQVQKRYDQATHQETAGEDDG